MDKLEPENELAALEARLGAFRPGPSRLDRDRLMYLAGQTAARNSLPVSRSRWAWPSAFAAMTTLAAALLVTLAVQHPQDRAFPSGPTGSLSPEADPRSSPPVLVEATPLSQPIPSPDNAPPGVSRRPGLSDIDALLAQLPTGRRLSQSRPWENAGPPPLTEEMNSPSTGRPLTYLKVRQMLIEQWMHTGREPPPQS